MKLVTYWHSEEHRKEMRSEHFIETSEEYNALFDKIKADKEWLEPMRKLCAHYYEKHSCGGNLHIVLDDDNINDHCVSWCAGVCSGLDDHEGGDIANLMQAMTIKQRKRLVEGYPYKD